MKTNEVSFTHEMKPSIFSATVAFNKKKKLFTSKYDFNIKKKLVKCYTWSVVFYTVESRSETPNNFET
jgi:hypothetical protein